MKLATAIIVPTVIASPFPSKPVTLTNPRYALPDASAPNGEGTIVGSWPGYDVSKAIDGNIGSIKYQGWSDHAAHPEEGAFSASFFVDLTESTIVDFVKIWPRPYTSGHYNYYEGREVYAGSILCPGDAVYSGQYLEDTLIPRREPMIYHCPPGTLASTIQYTKGTHAEDIVG